MKIHIKTNSEIMKRHTNYIEDIGKREKIFRLCSETDIWINMLIVVHEDDYEKAKNIVEQAFEDWLIVESGDSLIEYTKRYLEEYDIDVSFYNLCI